MIWVYVLLYVAALAAFALVAVAIEDIRYERLVSRLADSEHRTPVGDRTPVTGPHRITVDAIPGGLTLDVEPFVRALMADAVDILSGEQIDTIVEIADADPADPYGEERLTAEHLVELLTGRLSTKVPVYGQQVFALAERLRAVGMAPARREGAEGGAAA